MNLTSKNRDRFKNRAQKKAQTTSMLAYRNV